ncbi:MAG UNVERIFIED_CONTAM: hypothetical protein LVR18_08900 [Planctomycetaceae bacterium]|jgi:hypothetical protein
MQELLIYAACGTEIAEQMSSAKAGSEAAANAETHTTPHAKSSTNQQKACNPQEFSKAEKPELRTHGKTVKRRTKIAEW